MRLKINKNPSGKKFLLKEFGKNNPAVVQLLGLCPLLAVSSTATNALGLGLATMLVLTCTNTVISFSVNIFLGNPYSNLRDDHCNHSNSGSTFNECLHLYALSITGDFYSINCDQLYYYRSRRSIRLKKNSLLHSIWDGFSMGLGMALSLTILGALREIIGQGTIF